MTRPSLLIRADASVAIGTGHVMRCIALAQAWQDAGGRPVFAMADAIPAVQDDLRDRGYETVSLAVIPGMQDDIKQTVLCASEQQAEWVVLDGYQFHSDFQQVLKASGLRVLFLDDNGHAESYSADIVLNQNVHAADSLYERRQHYTRLLVGTEYSLLRREFTAWRDWKREIPELACKMLVTFGGSDPGNFTRAAMEAIRRIDIPGVDTVVVLGAANPHRLSLEGISAKSGGSLRLQQHVSDMASLMASSDVAVSAAGTTCLEMCFLGLPSIVISVAENQLNSGCELQRRGCAIHIDGTRNVLLQGLAARVKQLISDRPERQRLSHNARMLIDGKGATRVVSAMRENATSK
jgi:UDP-2,4-diacetamido-2,4,6-trideoxy-beta-L-altropyranose hydrolase